MGKIPFNQDIDEKTGQEFSAQAEERGYTKYRAVEGALRAFMALPSEVQVRLMSTNETDAYAILLHGLVDAELAKEIESLGPSKKEFLALVRQAIAKVSRKG